MNGFDYRHFTDPIHKSIGLSELESAIVGTPVFQRLRNVKQLGLTHLVFPGGDYSRFSHSLGVCHVTGLILNSIKSNCPEHQISDDDIKKYRLAGLLHDIGHYPFSHALEEPIKNYYGSLMLEDVGSGETNNANKDAKTDAEESDGGLERYFNHERVGREVVSCDPDILDILTKAGYEPEDVYSIFMRLRPTALANMVSSDLDADRIDYLLRTAHHTGLPYGSVDLSYILSQMRLDNTGRICLTEKALRSADHFLLCRYFDYSQVVFHKTVTGLERVLQDVFGALLEQGKIKCSASDVSDMVSSGKWSQFNDISVFDHIINLAEGDPESLLVIKAKALTDRRPPKQIWASEFIGSREIGNAERFRFLRKLLEALIGKLSAKFDLDSDLFYIWEQSGLTLTKIGSHVPVGSILEDHDEERDMWEQAVRVLQTGEESSTEIMSLEQSLMSLLAGHALYALRLYVVLPKVAEHLSGPIREFADAEMK